MRDIQPTAKLIYEEIRHESNIIAKHYSFKSFTRLIKGVKEVKGQTPMRGIPMTYMLR